YEVDFQSHAVKRGRRKNPKQRYCGRYSFSRTHFGEILRDENIQDRIRIRSTSIRGQAERVSRLESCSMYDAVYQCLSPEPDQQLHDVAVQPSAPISAVMMRRELARLSCDRNQYHYSLYRLLRASIMAKLNRLYENTTLGSVRKSSQKVLLINHRNERFKWSDVLWLQLQAAVAGRQMKSPRDQIRSTREHDKYLLVEREKQKAVLDEIRNFRLNNKIKARLPSQPPSADSYDQNSLKAGLKLVRNLLERYESFVALFPNIISMERSTKLDESIKTRIRILYAWYNITLDLYSRIKEVGVILGIYKNKESARCSSPSPNLVIKDTPTATQPVGVLSWPSLDSPMDDYESLKPSQKSCELTHASSSPQSLLLQMTMQTTSDLPALLEQPNSIYTAFVSRSLRRKGMRKVLQRLDSVCLLTIKKVIAMVKKSSVAHAQVVGDESKERSIDYITALTPECYISECLKFDDKQISDLPHGLTSHEQFSAMGLPSFENLFLFLTRVPLDLVHEWLKMRGSAQLPSDLLTLQTVLN
ncbi:unnamed protein product, partial [Thelazia callipaeda]|uniref:MEKK4_N domain-containing protein n=1 Tax=Thelazia callipaeda TaxID=103827 RepID=A0A0N5CSH6_THECL